MLGCARPAGPGVGEWWSTPHAPADALLSLAEPVAPNLRLVHTGTLPRLVTELHAERLALAAASDSHTPAPPPGIAVLAPGGAPDGAGAPQVPVRLPPPARLDFEVRGQAKRLQYSASAELVWQHDGQQYQARQEIRVLFLGSRAQTSVGEITPLGLQPRRFGDRSRSEKAAHFDFAQGQVTFSANNPAARIAPGAQDRLSLFLQLGALLRDWPAPGWPSWPPDPPASVAVAPPAAWASPPWPWLRPSLEPAPADRPSAPERAGAGRESPILGLGAAVAGRSASGATEADGEVDSAPPFRVIDERIAVSLLLEDRHVAVAFVVVRGTGIVPSKQ